MKTPAKIIIVGAGTGGLALSQCLKARGISSTIYDKSRGPRRYGYSIILDNYTPFLQAANIDFSTVHRRAAVQSSSQPPRSGAAFRARRAAFEDILREGCDIHYESEVTNVQRSSSTGKVEVQFSNQQDMAAADLLIAADGTHSTIRAALFPDFSLKVLPQVAFNGKRNISQADFAAMKPAFESAELLTPSFQLGDTLLQAYINEYDAEGGVNISYTYSRPSKGSADPCHKPNRPKAGATDIPQEFFTEVQESIQKSEVRDLEPWKSIFDVEKMKQDRLLHWLMRSGLPPQQDVEGAVERGVLLLGDALLTSPIIGSRGANVALIQAVKLAEAIENDAVKEWVRSNYESWRSTAREDISKL